MGLAETFLFCTWRWISVLFRADQVRGVVVRGGVQVWMGGVCVCVCDAAF